MKLKCRICGRSDTIKVVPLDDKYFLVFCAHCGVSSAALAVQEDLERYGLLSKVEVRR